MCEQNAGKPSFDAAEACASNGPCLGGVSAEERGLINNEDFPSVFEHGMRGAEAAQTCVYRLGWCPTFYTFETYGHHGQLAARADGTTLEYPFSAVEEKTSQ